jgi:hypothetical protein
LLATLLLLGVPAAVVVLSFAIAPSTADVASLLLLMLLQCRCW